jgi:hypothetical protein
LALEDGWIRVCRSIKGENMVREDSRLSQPAQEFVNVMGCAYPMPERYVARGFSAETYMVEAVPCCDQPALLAYLIDLLDGAPLDNEDLRGLMDKVSPWWGFETKCARTFLEGLRGSLNDRMKMNA